MSAFAGAASRLVVALDVPSAAEALLLCDRLGPETRWVKVGLELYVAEGPGVVKALAGRGLSVFLDLKFHDIPHTVERATARAAATGARLVNVHAAGGEEMMAAAARGAKEGAGAAGLLPPRVLAVTMLTSLTGRELPGHLAPLSMTDRVLLLARAAREAGLDGVVASPLELEALRAALGPSFVLLAPGIRFADGEPGDQKRVATPGAAVAAGADFLVMGRPLTGAAAPARAVDRALREIHTALQIS
jgi:orotidine-5'-phosphate decarboxylase